ncbi:MAG: zinc metallopeptidase [Chloroflexota bacterium]
MFYSDYYTYMIPAIILMMAAQWYVKSSYNKWSKVRNQHNITGAEAVQKLIRTGGLHGIEVERIGGSLSDHYDPRKKVLRLSSGVADNPSVAALAIAAHELGHAQQDQENYFPLRLRSAMVPMVNIGSFLGWIFIFAGLFFNMLNLSWLGVIFFAGGALFALATLPVEFDASSRAMRMLSNSGLIMSGNETRGARTVLNAAALTYVAALVQAVIQVLYYVRLVSGRRR